MHLDRIPFVGEIPKTEWVDWLNTKILQKAVIIDAVDNVLTMRRSKTSLGARPGKWDLPGGSIGRNDIAVSGKPHAAAIIREITEETGLTVEAIEATLVDSWTFQRSAGT